MVFSVLSRVLIFNDPVRTTYNTQLHPLSDTKTLNSFFMNEYPYYEVMTFVLRLTFLLPWTTSGDVIVTDKEGNVYSLANGGIVRSWTNNVSRSSAHSIHHNLVVNILKSVCIPLAIAHNLPPKRG